jgi:hypothetical protein
MQYDFDFSKTKKYLLKLRKRLHILSNFRAKQSIAPATPTIHIAYTMKIGHAFEVSIVEVLQNDGVIVVCTVHHCTVLRLLGGPST